MRCISSGGLIDFSSYFICLSKRTLKKKGHRSSMTLAEFFLEKFIPRREMQSISSRGPIVFTYVLFCLSKRTLKKKGHPSSVILAEFFPRNVLL